MNSDTVVDEIYNVKKWCIENRNSSPSFCLIVDVRLYIENLKENQSLLDAAIMFVVQTIERDGAIGDLMFTLGGVDSWKDLCSIFEGLEAFKYIKFCKLDKIQDLIDLDKTIPFRQHIRDLASLHKLET